jgi:hypothetical protein
MGKTYIYVAEKMYEVNSVGSVYKVEIKIIGDETVSLDKLIDMKVEIEALKDSNWGKIFRAWKNDKGRVIAMVDQITSLKVNAIHYDTKRNIAYIPNQIV